MKHDGSCLCGAVRFSVEGELHAPDACHCSQCRKQSGHYWASTNVKRDALKLEGADKLTWYQSSEKVRRGFCSVCGSFLFWDPIKHDIIAIGMGAFGKPTGTHIEKHIFVADKGDYYEITDGLPQEMGF
jgi:hypothetical protein